MLIRNPPATIQNEYYGLCGKLPDPNEFPADTVLDRGAGVPDSPFWLSLAACDSERLTQLEEQARVGKEASQYWTREVRRVADEVRGGGEGWWWGYRFC